MGSDASFVVVPKSINEKRRVGKHIAPVVLANELVDGVAVYAQRTISSVKVKGEGRVGDKGHVTTAEYIFNTMDRGVSMILEVVFVPKVETAVGTIMVRLV